MVRFGVLGRGIFDRQNVSEAKNYLNRHFGRDTGITPVCSDFPNSNAFASYGVSRGVRPATSNSSFLRRPEGVKLKSRPVPTFPILI